MTQKPSGGGGKHISVQILLNEARTCAGGGITLSARSASYLRLPHSPWSAMNKEQSVDFTGYWS